MPNQTPQNHNGPLRAAKLDAGDGVVGPWWAAGNTYLCNSWNPRDSISWWSDGTSNQVVFGEKHVPSSLVGQCGPALDTVTNDWNARIGECSYLSGTNWAAATHSRSFLFGWVNFSVSSGSGFEIGGSVMPLAKGNELATVAPIWGSGNFGSAHPGTCNFLIGDGAVRGISVTTPVNPILIALGVVNDGRAVALP
jgi:hypothetical protein